MRSEGGHIGDRGRIPKKYVEAYRKDPKDTSVIVKGDDDGDEPDQPQDENREPVGAGVGGDPFASF